MTEVITVAQPPKSLIEQAMERDRDIDRLTQIIELQFAQSRRSQHPKRQSGRGSQDDDGIWQNSGCADKVTLL